MHIGSTVRREVMPNNSRLRLLALFSVYNILLAPPLHAGHPGGATSFVLSQYESSECVLNEFGWGIAKHKPITYSGKKTNFDGSSLSGDCIVSIPWSEFQSKFEWCSLSGIQVRGATASDRTCNFTINRGKWAEFVASFAGEKGATFCSYICMVKPEK